VMAHRSGQPPFLQRRPARPGFLFDGDLARHRQLTSSGESRMVPLSSEHGTYKTVKARFWP